MTLRLAVGILAAVVTLTGCALADATGGGGQGDDSVLYLGQAYCQGVDYCPAFAFWGPDSAGYVELLEPDGKTVSDLLWVDAVGNLFYESSPITIQPPPGLPLLGKLIETGGLQEIDQFFPAGKNRPLFIQSAPPVPEPSTLLLAGPAGLLLFRRARRYLRG